MDENYKYLDTQRILRYLQQHKEGATVDAILQYSGADKLHSAFIPPSSNWSRRAG